MPTPTRRLLGTLLLATPLAFAALSPVHAAPSNFVVAWAASAHGPYPVGNATAQPELKFAFPDPAAGASDQTFRLIVRPDIWGRQARIRLSNAFGGKPVTFDAIHIGLQQSGSAILPGTNRPVTFGTKTAVTIAPGQSAVSDPVSLPFVTSPDDKMLIGRRLSVSFHVAGDSGPMTWHAKALTTSYVSPPNSGPHTAEETEHAFPYSTTSWYFLDAVDMTAPLGTKGIVAFGDSITDGTASTINGDDRWPDDFARRLHAVYGNRFSVVNEGIGGNMVIGPADYKANPFSGGPAATERLDLDVTSLAGVKTVLWLEGINDFGNANAKPEDVETGVRTIVKRLRAKIPGVQGVHGDADLVASTAPTPATVHPADGGEAPRLQPVHPHIRHFRRRGRLRRRHLRRQDRRTEGGVSAEFIDRRPRRQTAPKPSGIHGDGIGHRPEGDRWKIARHCKMVANQDPGGTPRTPTYCRHHEASPVTTQTWLNRIATAVPPHDIHAEFVEFGRQTIADWHKRLLFDRMAKMADIEHRYAIFEPGPKPRDKVLDATGFYRRGAFPSTAARMALYEPHALDLAMQAVQALDTDPAAITHLIVASCTGFSAPGLDFQIMRAAGLPDSTHRTIVGFMGCFAAVNVLKLADQIVRADRQSRVLVVNLELCSLHLQEDFQNVPKMLSFLLFADGASAALVTAEQSGLALGRFQATLIPRSQDLITWHIGDSGFEMQLSGQVPGRIRRWLPDHGPKLLPPDTPSLWAVHAGGRSILDSVQQGLHLDPGRPTSFPRGPAGLRQHVFGHADVRPGKNPPRPRRTRPRHGHGVRPRPDRRDLRLRPPVSLSQRSTQSERMDTDCADFEDYSQFACATCPASTSSP